MDTGWWILMSIVWIALIAGIVWAAVRLLPSRGHGSSEEREEPEKILARRLAAGEIDADTYDRLRGELREPALSVRK